MILSIFYIPQQYFSFGVTRWYRRVLVFSYMYRNEHHEHVYIISSFSFLYIPEEDDDAGFDSTVEFADDQATESQATKTLQIQMGRTCNEYVLSI